MNRRLVRLLRFCLCRRVSFAQSSYWLINSYPAPGVQIVESATLHYLKAWNKLISSCFLLPLSQILAETRLSIHDSPFPADDQDTVETFPAPPDPAGKVYCPLSPPPPPLTLASSLPSQLPMLQNLLALKPWSLIRSCTKVRFGQTSVLSCEISWICNNCGVDSSVTQLLLVSSRNAPPTKNGCVAD